MKVSRVEEMRNLDRRATEEYGISEDILMENAAAASYFVILKELGIRSKRFVFFCGSGNNGGDGLAVARKIHSMGGDVVILLLGEAAKLKGAAKKNFDVVSRLPVEIRQTKSAREAREEVSRCDAVIDAIFGTGLMRDVSGTYAEMVDVINSSGKPVFSLDIPSGVNGDTGAVMGRAVRSDYTITFGLPKIGNILYPGFELCGKLYVSHISFPPSLYEGLRIQLNRLVELPARPRDSHKGTFGRALFISGAANYLGAPYFSALSFLKTGGGLSYLATPKSVASFLASKGSEIVVLPQAETDEGSLAESSLGNLVELAAGADMVVLGPGVSLNSETQELVRQLVRRIEVPLLLDGDGITAASADLAIIRNRKAPIVITPHSGEMARIAQMSVDDVNKEKLGLLQRVTSDLGAIIVFKGARSLIGYPDGSVDINLSGNPGMATAGSGDALTGAISAAYCTGLPLEEAARMGVFLHGLSGDLAAEEIGEDGMTAQDVVDYLPEAVRCYREYFESLSENFYGSVYSV